MSMDRRNFLKKSAGVSAGTMMFDFKSSSILAAPGAEPHFFLQLIANGGLDCAYTFDSRPLAMTKEKIIQNRLGEEPLVYKDRHGRKTLRTKLMNPLMKHIEDFAILNGVIMSAGFDGHPQNVNYLLTGNPFGGESFVPMLNQAGSRSPLDNISMTGGFFQPSITNGGGSVQLSATSMADMSQKLLRVEDFGGDSRIKKFLQQRLQNAASKGGRFGSASGVYGQALSSSPEIQSVLREIQISENVEGQTGDSIQQSGEMLSAFFQKRIARAATYITSFDTPLDAHDVETAKNLSTNIEKIFTDFAALIQMLKDTPYDKDRSLFDLTTVMICSEFGRTMRQEFQADFDNSGTDHNPLTNTVLIGGKGISGNQIIGQTDMASVEAYANPSKAHLQMDPNKTKMMGLPFDFRKQQAVATAAAEFDVGQYMSFTNITNTLLSLYGLPESALLPIERNGPVAPLISSLLA